MERTDLKMLEINETGTITKKTLIETGVTLVNGQIIDRNSKIHIRGIDLKSNGAAVVSILLGDDVIFDKTFTAAGDDRLEEADRFISTNENRILSMSITTSATVTGRIFYCTEYTGGKVQKSS
jgi:ribosome-associated protein YbcJ (S4-like RNA binding protein)